MTAVSSGMDSAPASAIRRWLWGVLFATLWFAPDTGYAVDLPAGVTLIPTSQRYFVLRDALLRDAPDNAAKRIGQLARGQQVHVMGKAVLAKSPDVQWLAVRRPDHMLGFVFGRSLAPMIDGTLPVPLEGVLSAPGRPECRYTIAFDGKSKVADDLQQTADYDVAFDCRKAGAPLAFSAGMFITEMPYKDAAKEAYQINVDLWDVRVNDEEVLSVTALYDAAGGRVTFEAASDWTLASGKDVGPVDAPNVPAALAGALAIAHKVWQDDAWKMLAEQRRAAEEPSP